jgi:hypothetical protein
MDVKFPNIKVKLVGDNGNAFAILGIVTYALKRAGVDKEERDLFVAEASAGDYDHAIQTCMKWVDCE